MPARHARSHRKATAMIMVVAAGGFETGVALFAIKNCDAAEIAALASAGTFTVGAGIGRLVGSAV